MNTSPAYFEPIRQRAAHRWDQLEGDPELAGPWHLLFKQVQSPRHILSELLQNADDAGATEASVFFEDNAFIFQHNGEDFTEEHFASICRFGYSNKRALHTIGFRGVGFKSTFSLGERVELFTPTLSVSFHENRFTEPKWANDNLNTDGLTTIRVAIRDDHRRVEVEKNLEDWLKSPVSLLFFKNIRRIQIGDSELHWGSLGPGPVPNTEWLALHDNEDESFLIARSAPEAFPEEALAEIKQERMLAAQDDTEFPPSVVEIVLGVEGRLFVVLPTGVKTALPFACNAPFIQDPSRREIKGPGTSPTNRWLLQRAGKLAAEVMLEWLQQSSANLAERAKAYDLMPNIDHESSSLAATCCSIVEKEFSKIIQGREILITDEGQLRASRQCIILPRAIMNVWPSVQAAALFDNAGRPALSEHVSDINRKKLLNLKLIDAFSDDDVLQVLQRKHLPRPKSSLHMLNLWSYIAPSITGYQYYGRKAGLCIFPVQGKEVLYAADEIVHLGEKKFLPPGDDWQFLGDWLSVLDQNWLRYLAEQRRLAGSNSDAELSKRVKAAFSVLNSLSLSEPSDPGKIIARVAVDFFKQETMPLADAVRFAQIAAKLGASVGETFRFFSQDFQLRSASDTLLLDHDGALDRLLPNTWSESHLLHPVYLKSFLSCTREEWFRWVSNGRSGLHTFVPLSPTQSGYLSRIDMDKELGKKNYNGSLDPKYKNPLFRIFDWDFSDNIWKHWEVIAETDNAVWGKVVEKVLMQPSRFWSANLTATAIEESRNGNTSRLIRDSLTPLWILKLRNKNCLRDTHGIYRKPEELLRRTPDTESLMDVELFVDGHLDNENSRPILRLLGVGDTPTGPDKLLGRLQALAKADNPPAHEVEKWYRRLDQMIDGCSTEDFATIKDSFANAALILTENGAWDDTSGVFLSSDEEDAPGAETVRASVRELTLWRKIGVADRPTVELAINWLQGLPSGQSLSPEDARRVRALLSRHASRIWDECQHWPNLAGEWMPVEEFDYSLTMQTLIPWSHFHQWVKKKTADLQRLSADIAETPPFSDVPPLTAHVDEQVDRKGMHIGDREEREWLQQLGVELRRIKLDDEDEAERIKGLASSLATTAWQTTRNLEVISYIDGKPAGTSRRADIIWEDQTLYAEDRPMAKLARSVAQELGRSFRRPDITDAIKLCFDRPLDFVTEYIEENFSLNPREEIEDEEPVVSSPQESSTTNDESGAQGRSGETDNLGDDDWEPDQEDEFKETEVAAANDDSDGPSGASDENDDHADAIPTPGPKPKANRPSIMERFALGQGYEKDGESRFFDDHGNWIGKANGTLFPWEQRSASGEVIRHYWPKDHCLEREPLQLDAEIWGIVENQPETYALVLSNPEGNPVEISGRRLCEMREHGDLTLHPSTYRLVYEHDK
jgi:hypothetical protein